MTAEEIIILIGAIGFFWFIAWFWGWWDERRMDREIQKKYPKPETSTPLPKRISWEQKKISIEHDLKRAHKICNEYAWVPVACFLITETASFKLFEGLVGLLFGIPFGLVAYYIGKLWSMRGLARSGRALAEHLQSDRDVSYPQ